MWSRPGDVSRWRRLCDQPEHGPSQLRCLRDAVYCRSDLLQGHLCQPRAMPSRPRDLWRRWYLRHQPCFRSSQLRRLRHAVCGGPDMRQGTVRPVTHADGSSECVSTTQQGVTIGVTRQKRTWEPSRIKGLGKTCDSHSLRQLLFDKVKTNEAGLLPGPARLRRDLVTRNHAPCEPVLPVDVPPPAGLER